MRKMRIPISFRLFIIVFVTTSTIATVGLAMFNLSMQRNFSRYVAEAEVQKLDPLVENLASLYANVGQWSNVISQSYSSIADVIDSKDKARLERRWLRRQYDIAAQQNFWLKQSFLNQKVSADGQIETIVPSHFEPFSGYANVWKKYRNHKQRARTEILDKEDGFLDGIPARHWFMPTPEQLSLGNRLALYDKNKDFVTGYDELSDSLPMRPIMIDHQVIGYLGLKPALSPDDALSLNFFASQSRYLMLIYSISFIVSAFAASILAAYFRHPIRQIHNASFELIAGNYQHHVDINRNDEFGDLSLAMNQLADILHQHEQSRQRWVADTSHELKTPISVLQAQIEAMQDGVRQATPEHLQSMANQIYSLKRLTKDLSDLALADAHQLKCYIQLASPWHILQQVVESFQPRFEQKKLTVELTGDSPQLMIDPDRFRQIVVNLLENSVRYTEENGRISIHTEQNKDFWILHIEDSPLSLNDEQIARLGERFYRVDDSRTRATGGTGLGLALSKQLAQAQSGDLTFSHSKLGGLKNSIRLPLVTQR